MRSCGASCSLSPCSLAGPSLHPGQATAWKTYADTVHGYAFEDSTRPIDPIYAADLSGAGSYYLLLIGSRLNEPGVPVDTVRAIVATIRRLTKAER